MYSALFSSLLCCVVLCAAVAVLCNVLILVALSALVLVLARDVWENLGKWNKNGCCVFWISRPGGAAGGVSVWCCGCVLCGAVAGVSLPLDIGLFWCIGLFTPPFFCIFRKIF